MYTERHGEEMHTDVRVTACQAPYVTLLIYCMCYFPEVVYK